MGTRGWSDIGYNALICSHARLIEGRGRDVVGAHCTGHNSAAVGVQFMVGGDEKPTPEMYARARRFYDECCRAGGRTLRKLGHRDGFATSCPGDVIEAWVKAGMPAKTDPAKATPTPVPTTPTGAPPYAGRVLRRGSSGAEVRKMQQRLKDRGWRIDVDGVFGPATEAVVRAFQADKRLAVDGEVGRDTWTALWSAPIT